MTTYRVTHTTSYTYGEKVSSSYGEAHLLPRDLEHQQSLSRSLTIDPAPHDLRQRTDYFGNRTAFFTIRAPHLSLSITATSVVSVQPPTTSPLFGGAAWEDARDALVACATPEAAAAVEFTLDSPLVGTSPALADLARPHFEPGRPLLDAVASLSSAVHDGFAYDPKATTVTSTIDEVLAKQAGVCQDFAHVVVGALRSLGLAARYVSGYLETVPPPGQERLVGADRSHAWASVWVPDAGWIDVDPTNDRFVNDRYVTTAWGRDYKDVPPVKGVIFTAGKTHELEVSVDVTRVDGAG